MHTLYLVSAAEAENRLEQHFAAVDAAAAAGVQRIVYTSFVGASPDAAFTLVRQHYATEERIRATGIRHTLLRHNMYADFVPFFATIEDDGAVIAAPAGEGRTGFVSRDDLADVAAAVLLRDRRRARRAGARRHRTRGADHGRGGGRADRDHRAAHRVTATRRSRRRGRPAVPPGTPTGRSRAG